MCNSLTRIYDKLYRRFGPQHWWPGEGPFEVMVGAILTQNTNWSNVEKAIASLKKESLLSAHRLNALPARKLAIRIRSSGYYNLKAERLKAYVRFFLKSYQGQIKKMARLDTQFLRTQLLSVRGIGQETADSIMLYALNKPIFVVDAYTKRMLMRHAAIKEDASYSQIQNLFMDNLKPSAKLFNEYHALLVRLGKEFCLKSNPGCTRCPLKGIRIRGLL